MEAGADPEPRLRGTQADYARHRGVSREAVRQACRAGRVALGDDGLIDFAAADESWELNTDLTKPRNSVTGNPRARAPAASTTSLAQHKATHEEWKARRAELEYRERAGELLPKADVDQAVFEAQRRARDRLLAIEVQIAPLLSPEALRMLREEIRRACDDLASS